MVYDCFTHINRYDLNRIVIVIVIIFIYVIIYFLKLIPSGNLT